MLCVTQLHSALSPDDFVLTPDIAVKANSDLVPKQTDIEAYGLFEQGVSAKRFVSNTQR